MKLLIVEDNENQIRQYLQAITKWNNDGHEIIEFVFAKNIDEANGSLFNNSYDVAILDLRFPGDEPSHASGNDILSTIRNQLRYPVYVVSGNPKELDEQFDNHPLIQLVVRGSIKNSELLERIYKRYTTGITKILGNEGVFEEALDKVFWNHMSNALSHWEEVELPSEVKEKQLLRYTLSHLQEILAVDNLGKDEKCNTAEVYIKPAVRTSISPGMIVQKENDKFMVITPACDISQDRADYFQLVKLFMFEELDEIKRKGRTNKRKEIIRDLISNSKGRYHFLPSYDDLNDTVIDFQHITTISKDEVDDKFCFICTITTPFFKDIVNRFSSYYARQGSPDFETDTLSEELHLRLHETPVQ